MKLGDNKRHVILYSQGKLWIDNVPFEGNDVVIEFIGAPEPEVPSDLSISVGEVSKTKDTIG